MVDALSFSVALSFNVVLTGLCSFPIRYLGQDVEFDCWFLLIAIHFMCFI